MPILGYLGYPLFGLFVFSYATSVLLLTCKQNIWRLSDACPFSKPYPPRNLAFVTLLDRLGHDGMGVSMDRCAGSTPP
jgi:hypothetical protein